MMEEFDRANQLEKQGFRPYAEKLRRLALEAFGRGELPDSLDQGLERVIRPYPLVKIKPGLGTVSEHVYKQEGKSIKSVWEVELLSRYGLDIGSINALLRGEIYSLDSLATMTEKNIVQVNHIGRTRATAIQTALTAFYTDVRNGKLNDILEIIERDLP